MRFPTILCWSALSLLLMAARLPAFQEAQKARATLDVQHDILVALSADVLGRAGIAPGGKIRLRVESMPENWIAQQAFIEALRTSGHEVMLGDSTGTPSAVTIELRGASAWVRYSDSFRDGFLGPKMTVRSVTAGFRCLVVTGGERTVLVSDTFSGSRADTVRVDDLPDLESASVPSTHGDLPADGFLDRIVEPFVIVGATGVAVYLLFNIRS